MSIPHSQATTHEHALGGVHVLVWEGRELVGHGSVVMRRLLHGGRALRTGYVEGVAVRADRRQRGHGATVMDTLERVIRGAYEIGALGTSEVGVDFYAARGWQRWTGTASVIAPGGIERTEDDEDGIYVLPVSAVLTPDGDLACALTFTLQWGPVVMTGISTSGRYSISLWPRSLQWGPVVMTGISAGRHDRTHPARSRLQWGPVVMTGIRACSAVQFPNGSGASMGSGRDDRNQHHGVDRCGGHVLASMGSGRDDRNQRRRLPRPVVGGEPASMGSGRDDRNQ